jgi:alpha-beta hydrolase superfamily lysophospholipase
MQSSPTLNPQSDRHYYQGVVQPKGFPSLPQGWVSEWETFPSSDGSLQLYSVLHHPSEWKSHQVLVVLHGLGEHGGRYLHVPHFVQSVVGAVFCLDHRGHGRSEGLRGHVDRFDDYADDAALAIARIEEQVRKRFGQSEIHLLGHSMGGLITLRTLFLHPSLPIRSASASASLLGIRAEVPKLKKWAGKALSRVWGSLHMNSELDATQLSHDKEVITSKRDSGIQHPLQFLVPLQDKIVDPDTQLEFFRNLKLRDKALKTYPTFYHESFNEIGKEQVFEDLVSWIRSHS